MLFLLESLNNCIEACEQITEEIKSSSRSEWTKRMMSIEENWESSRSLLYSIAMLYLHHRTSAFYAMKDVQ
jgi:hypothetical protein